MSTLPRVQLYRQRTVGRRKRHSPHIEIVLADARETGLFALRVFVREEDKSFVLLDRAAEREAALCSRVGLLNGIQRSGYRIDLAGKGIARLKGLVAEVPEGVSMKFVGAALAHDVDDAPAGAAVLGVVIAQNELKLLDALLREGRANGVDGVIDGIRAVNAHHGSTGSRPTDAQTAIRRGADGGRNVSRGLRVGQSEIDVAAAVNGEVVDAALLHGLGDVRLGGFDVRGLGHHYDGLQLPTEHQLDVSRHGIAHCEHNRSVFVNLEIRSAVDSYIVLTRRKSNEVVAAVIF